MSENTNPETPYSGDPVPEPFESAASEPTPDFLSLSDAEVPAPEPTEFSAVESPAPADPFQAPPGLDLGNPDAVAQASYGQTQDAYTQPDPQAGYVPPAQPMPQAEYAPPPPPAPGYGVQPGVPAPGPYAVPEDRSMASMAHWLSILIGFIAPLIIMLTKGEQDRFVRDNSVEALNFDITLAIGYVATAVLSVVTFGIAGFLYLPIWIVGLVFQIQGSMAANRGEVYRYPVNIRMVK